MPCFGLDLDIRRKVDWTAARKAYAECRHVAPMMLGDYYPLTPHSLDESAWIAWQFNRPEEGDGVVQAFRREKNRHMPAVTFLLSGLDPAAQYEVTDFDAERSTKTAGKDLMGKGLPVQIKDTPGSAVIVYRRIP